MIQIECVKINKLSCFLSIFFFLTRILQSTETGTCTLWRNWGKVTCYLCRLVWVWQTYTREVVRFSRASQLVRKREKKKKKTLSVLTQRGRHHGHLSVWTQPTPPCLIPLNNYFLPQNSTECICNIGLNFL